MAYRRKRPDFSAESAWRSWLIENRETLASLGLPLELYSSRRAWEDFLSNGAAVLGARDAWEEFDFNTMSIAQQKALHAFLEQEMGTREPMPGLLGYLRVRAEHDWVPPYL